MDDPTSETKNKNFRKAVHTIMAVKHLNNAIHKAGYYLRRDNNMDYAKLHTKGEKTEKSWQTNYSS